MPTVLLPAAVGVPVMAPVVGLRVNPAGRLPEVTAQEYGVRAAAGRQALGVGLPDGAGRQREVVITGCLG